VAAETGNLAAALRAALAAAPPSAHAAVAQRFCAEVALPALARGDTAGAADCLALLSRLPPAAGLPFVRASFAQQLAARQPDDLAPLAAYVRAVPAEEALGCAVDLAVTAWERCGDAPDARDAIQLAALAIAHVLTTSAGPPWDKPTYNLAVAAMRELFTRLAEATPPADRPPPPRGVIAEVIAAARQRLDAWGFAPAVGERIKAIVDICRDYGESLPRSGRYPGRAWLG
jgi:hypothetical protein